MQTALSRNVRLSPTGLKPLPARASRVLRPSVIAQAGKDPNEPLQANKTGVSWGGSVLVQ